MFNRSFDRSAPWLYRPRVVTLLRMMWRTARSRALLREMEPRLLQDIGITRTDALAEASRPWWDIDLPEGGQVWSPGAMLRRWHGRSLLRRLNARGVRDLGRSYAEIEAEANKPFWRA